MLRFSLSEVRTERMSPSSPRILAKPDQEEGAPQCTGCLPCPCGWRHAANHICANSSFYRCPVPGLYGASCISVRSGNPHLCSSVGILGEVLATAPGVAETGRLALWWWACLEPSEPSTGFNKMLTRAQAGDVDATSILHERTHTQKLEMPIQHPAPYMHIYI